MIIVNSNNNAMGTVTGGGTYNEGATATLTATANNGYHFTQWQDGNTQNPRTVTVTSNATYTANFEATQYTLTVTSANPSMGTVTGGGTYNEGATAMLTATANNGYHFTQWQDGNAQNPRTVTVTGNATYTASFEANPPTQYTITVTSANPTMGTVTGGGTYNEGATAMLTATANNGYHFTQWQDGNTQNPRTVTVTGNATYTASFEANPPTQYTITVTSANPTMGTVTGGGTYNEGATATLTATANNGYHFTQWQDGNTDNPRTVTVTANATYTASFESDAPTPVDPCLITTFPYTENFDDTSTYGCLTLYDANGDGESWGIIDSFDTAYSRAAYIMYAVQANDYLILPGIITPGNYSLTWKARAYNASYPETYQVYSGDSLIFSETLTATTLTTRSAAFAVSAGDTVNIAFRYISDDQYAFFLDDITIAVAVPTPTQYTITVTSANPTMGTVTGGGTYIDGATATLTATANSGYHFTQWQDGNTDNPRTVTVTGNATYTASFEANPPTQYTITATSANPTMGTVTGGGTYNEGTTATLTATANSGYHFTQWQDGNTDNPRTVTVTSNATYTASFEANPPTQYTITVTSTNPTMGTVSGGGTYNEGTTATLTATANSGYHFTQWQDGNTQNPRTITVTSNATYTAYFEADGGDDDCPTITSFPWNATFDENLTCWKTVDADGDGYNWMNYQDYVVSESYSYFDGTNQGLTPDNWLISQRIQIPSSGTYTLSWTAAGLSDDYYNEHYSVYVSTTGDSPSDFTTPLFSETLNTPNAVNRSKSLENYRGQTVRIAFRHHNTNDVFVLGVGNVTISQNTQGIDDIDENGVHVYSEGHNIHVNEADGQSVTVYAIDGRTISAVTNATGCLSIPVAAAGVYIVKVGEHPARKVVVIR